MVKAMEYDRARLFPHLTSGFGSFFNEHRVSQERSLFSGTLAGPKPFFFPRSIPYWGGVEGGGGGGCLGGGGGGV